MTVASVQGLEYFGASTPDGFGAPVRAPVGSTYVQVPTGVRWFKYGANDYNWTPQDVPARAGWLLRDDAMVQQWLSLSHAGTGTEVVSGEAGHPGVLTQSVTSTATPDRSRVLHFNSNPGNILLGGGAAAYAEYLVNTPTVQDAVDRWSDRRGYIDTALSIEPTNGAYFESNLAVNGNANWWGVTCAAGVYTKTNLGIPPAAGVWQRLRLEINALGNAVRFLIDDTLIATNVANISTAAALWVASQMVKTLGDLNARTVKYDYVEASEIFATNR